MEDIGAVEMVWKELRSVDDKLRRGKAVLYHPLDDSRI